VAATAQDLPALASDEQKSIVDKLYNAAVRKSRVQLYVTLTFAVFGCSFGIVAWKDQMQLAVQIFACSLALVGLWVVSSMISEAVMQSGVAKSQTTTE